MTRRRGLVQLVLSALLFGVMAYATKRATHRIGGAQAALVRFGVGLLVVGLSVVGRRVSLQPRRYDLLGLRGALGGIAVLLYFNAIQRIPVGTATLLHYTQPVWTTLLAALFLREPPPPRSGLALAVTALGIVLVVHGQGQVMDTVRDGAYGWQLVSLASAIVAGAAVTSIRAARRHDGPWEVFTAFCSIGALITLPSAAMSWTSPTPSEWLLLLAIGLLAVLAQLLMTHALGRIRAATGGIVGQLTVVTAMLLGCCVDGDRLTFWSGFGALLTILGVTLGAASARASVAA